MTLIFGKTAVIYFSTKFYGKGPIPPRDLHVGDVSISNAMCNLGPIMGPAWTMSNVMAKVQSLHVIFMLAPSVYLMLCAVLGPIWARHGQFRMSWPRSNPSM